MEGSLIEREKYDRVVETLGIAIKNAVVGLPARAIPEILAAPDPQASENALHRYMEELLNNTAGYIQSANNSISVTT